MIAGAVRGAGGPRLAKHLLNPDDNERVRISRGRGVASRELHGQIKELVVMSAHGNTKRPLLHVHANPAKLWSEADWKAYWSDFEAEFGLDEQPFAEATHVKSGRQHVHRVYTVVRLDGKVVDLRHDYARREKVSRVAEHRTGEALTGGRHNRAVANALLAEGRHDVAEAMDRAGLLKANRPAALSPIERHRAERTAIDLDDLRRDAWMAWRSAANAQQFKTAIEAKGYRLAIGERSVVIMDRAAGIHPVGRLVSAGAKQAGAVRPAAAAVRAKLAGLSLPTVAAEGLVAGAPSGTRHATPANISISRPPAKLGAPPERSRSPSVSDSAAAVSRPPTISRPAVVPKMQKDQIMKTDTQPADVLDQFNGVGPGDLMTSGRSDLDVTALLLLATWSRSASTVWLINLIARIERLNDCYAFFLTTSERIAVQHSRILHLGEPSKDGAAMIVEIAKAKGWQSMRLWGSPEFQDAVVRAAVRAGMSIANPELQELADKVRREQAQAAFSAQHAAWPPNASFFDDARIVTTTEGEKGKVGSSDHSVIARAVITAAKARRSETNPEVLKKFGLQLRALASDAVAGGYSREVELLIDASTEDDERSYVVGVWKDRVETEFGRASSDGRIPDRAPPQPEEQVRPTA